MELNKDRELAKIAEQAERYQDMAAHMVKFVKKKGSGDDLSVEERNLLSVAFKNIVGSKRTAWRVLSNILLKEQVENRKKVCEQEIRIVEDELKSTCDDVVDLIDNQLLQQSNLTPESRVFYLKMKADYFRYLAEVGMGGESAKADFTQKSEDAYEEACKAAEDIEPVHPIKLGLFLNYSVFRFEIQQDSKKACEMAQSAFDEAVKNLENLNEDQYKDSVLIVQLLRDNLSLWNSDADADQQGDDYD